MVDGCGDVEEGEDAVNEGLKFGGERDAEAFGGGEGVVEGFGGDLDAGLDGGGDGGDGGLGPVLGDGLVGGGELADLADALGLAGGVGDGNPAERESRGAAVDEVDGDGAVGDDDGLDTGGVDADGEGGAAGTGQAAGGADAVIVGDALGFLEIGDDGAGFQIKNGLVGDLGGGGAVFGDAFEEERGVGGDDGFDAGHRGEDDATIGAGDDAGADDDGFAFDDGAKGGLIGTLDGGCAAGENNAHGLRGEGQRGEQREADDGDKFNEPHKEKMVNLRY